MKRIQCSHCKQDVYVVLYFYDDKIIKHESNMTEEDEYYEARVFGKAICPSCGHEIREVFKRVISRESIIDLSGARGE